MNLSQLKEDLSARGIKLSARIVVDAPLSSITKELVSVITKYKPQLLQEIARDLVWESLRLERWGPGLENESIGDDADTPIQ